MAVHRQEHHGHAIAAQLAQLHPQPVALQRKKRVRDLDQNSRAIARFRIAAGRAAMGEIDQDLQALANNVVTLLAADARDQTHATGIVLIPRVIEPLRCGNAVMAIRWFHGNLPLTGLFP